MELELKKPIVNHYTNADHVESNELLYLIFGKHAGVINAPSLLMDYRNKPTQEESVFKWMKKSEYTEKKAAADHGRDRTLDGIVGVLLADLKHFDPSVRDNAKHVLNLFENYGDLTKNGYDAETPASKEKDGTEQVVELVFSKDYTVSYKNNVDRGTATLYIKGIGKYVGELTTTFNIQ